MSIYEASDKKIPYQIYGEYQYDNVLLFCPLHKDLKAFGLRDFVEQGGNVLMASSDKLSTSQRTFAAESGVTFHPKNSLLMDHFHYLPQDNDTLHSTILADDIAPIPVVVGSKLASASKKMPVVFQGLGQTLDEENILSFSILHPSATAYSANPYASSSSSSTAFGADISLLSAVQARNNARMVFSGSTLVFQDQVLMTPECANVEFVRAVSQWVCGETGVLDTRHVRHAREDGSKPEKMLNDIERPDEPISLYPEAEIARDSLVYRIKDNLTYAFELYELQGELGWVPFEANDIQLEFVMLDPYVRKNMQHDGEGRYTVTFEAPDAYGIFQFRVLYRRRGYTTVRLSTQVSLRPFKHNEYERFILSAYPYYASAFSMMAGVFVFSLFFLYSED